MTIGQYNSEQAIAEFKGECLGIALVARGPGDSHICFQIITEDDGNWFISSAEFSSYWLPELKSLLNSAVEWLINNAETYIFDEEIFGWKIKGQF